MYLSQKEITRYPPIFYFDRSHDHRTPQSTKHSLNEKFIVGITTYFANAKKYCLKEYIKWLATSVGLECPDCGLAAAAQVSSLRGPAPAHWALYVHYYASGVPSFLPANVAAIVPHCYRTLQRITVN